MKAVVIRLSRVTATGARAFYLIYRAAGSEKKSFLWIGDAGRMSLTDARDRAREADRLCGQGSDPVEERKREERAQRQRPKVAALLSAFVDAGESRKSEKTQDEYRRIVTAEIEGTPVAEKPPPVREVLRVAEHGEG
jgi:hypothetical protein